MTAPETPTTQRIVGLDLSLSATGICDEAGARVITTRLRGMERLDHLRGRIISHVNAGDLVLVEGYAMGTGRQAGTYSIGELGGTIRLMLWDHGISYVEIPPAVLKKFATNKGNAGKPDMLAAAIRSGYEGPNDDNCVDAWWLRQLGEYANTDEGHPLTTAYRDEAVAKIEWPADHSFSNCDSAAKIGS